MRATPNVIVTIAEQRFEGVLDGEELTRAIELLGRDVPNSHLLRGLLTATVLEDVFGDEETIALESPPGERLVARCRESAQNPMLLEFRLADMLRTRASQPERRTLED